MACDQLLVGAHLICVTDIYVPGAMVNGKYVGIEEDKMDESLLSWELESSRGNDI